MFINNSSITLINVTVSGNMTSWTSSGAIHSHASSVTLVNSILWNDSSNEIYLHETGDPNNITIAYSNIQGGQEGIITNDNGTVNWLDGNINADPFFCNQSTGDFSLAENSLCIGTGENGVNMGSLGVGCGPLEVDIGQFDIPLLFALHQNYPNPFNTLTSIKYSLQKDSFIKLRVYDLLSREIRTLVNGKEPASYRSIIWDGTDNNGKPVSSGMYFYRLDAYSLAQVPLFWEIAL